MHGGIPFFPLGYFFAAPLSQSRPQRARNAIELSELRKIANSPRQFRVRSLDKRELARADVFLLFAVLEEEEEEGRDGLKDRKREREK